MKNFKLKLLSLAVLLICVSLAQSCSDNDDGPNIFPVPLKAIDLEGSLEEDQAKVQELQAGILEIAQSVPCIDANDWKITPLGYKTCGGPVSYIAYPIEIDKSDFLQLVEVYRLSQKALIAKWDLASTCELPAVPEDVKCEDNQAVLVY